jgi:hypothetical protein
MAGIWSCLSQPVEARPQAVECGDMGTLHGGFRDGAVHFENQTQLAAHCVIQKAGPRGPECTVEWIGTTQRSKGCPEGANLVQVPQARLQELQGAGL